MSKKNKVTKEKIDDAIKGDVPSEFIGEQYELLLELKELLSEDLEMAEELAKQIDAETDAEKKEELESGYIKFAERIKLTMYGYNKFSRVIMKQVENDLVIKRPSPNVNKKRNIDRDARIVKDLQKYYDNDLPLKHNVKSYLHELADKHHISFRRIKQIAEDNRPGNSSK